MGCKYNLQEFKPFVSGKKKITPTVTDDWELIADGSFSRKTGVGIHSEKLQCTIYDADFVSFLNFLKTEDVTMQGAKIQGRFVMGQQRVLRKEEDYLVTMKLKGERFDLAIAKEEWIPGHIYETACGSSVLYIGMKYHQSITPVKGIPTLSRLAKKYFGIEGVSDINAPKPNYYMVRDCTPRKFVKDLGLFRNWSDQSKDDLFDKYLKDDRTNVIFSDIKPVGPTGKVVYEFREVPPNSIPSGYYITNSFIKIANNMFMTVTVNRNPRFNFGEILERECYAVKLEDGFKTEKTTIFYNRQSANSKDCYTCDVSKKVFKIFAIY